MIPERYKNADWKDVPAPVQKAVAEMLAGGKGIYLHGGVGVGKTHIVYALQKHLEETGGYCRVWNVSELIREIKMDFDRQEKRRPEEFLLTMKSPVVLDDLGAEKVTEFVSEMLYLITNSRYNAMLPTVFTSNLNPAELAERIGERSASRVIEMCKIINMTGADRRIK